MKQAYWWTGRQWRPVEVLGASRKAGFLRISLAGQTTVRLVPEKEVRR